MRATEVVHCDTDPSVAAAAGIWSIVAVGLPGLMRRATAASPICWWWVAGKVMMTPAVDT
ncbi:hypothetical protein PWY87_30705 [Kribbella solani]|uniref:hypothetical protein n=1 Tax=Kribbella solani TaxID=236067 RepID=UPI0029A33CA5|nr:hypothetical protein [Kribbella solani]MDX2974666.1 hypothetical protein [Kribbella solani]MDX3006086.1 hypothetical protein [Kribbella solani]